jgi:hypothetical protein
VSIVEPETEPTDAEMVVVPADGPLVTRPLVPAVLLIVATLPDDEFHIKGDVRSKTTCGEPGAGVDALGGGGGRSFGRSKNSAGRCGKKKQ